MASAKLRWMEFFDDLLLPDGNFDSQYGLDGTHMSPSYVPFIQRSLSAAAPATAPAKATPTPAKRA
jgi:hypothetical protein